MIILKNEGKHVQVDSQDGWPDPEKNRRKRVILLDIHESTSRAVSQPTSE